MGGPLENLEQYQPALDEALARHGVILAYLYGSQARGDAGSLSDVDVAVKFGPGLSARERFDHLLHLIGELGSVFRRDDVYLVDLSEVPPLLCHRIYLEHRLLYCPDDTVRIAFETRALQRYITTRPLRNTRWCYVRRRIAAGRYGRFGDEERTMIDVEVIQQRLVALEEFVSQLDELRAHGLEEWGTDVLLRHATERTLQVAIQRILNIATHILAADFAIPADDYADVIRALGKAGVLPADFAERFAGIAGLYNVLVEMYVETDPVKVYEHLQRDPDDIRFFVRCIVEYLERKGVAEI